MGHGRHVSGSTSPTGAAPPPAADYNVATNPELVPDCSCNYFYAGEHEANPWFLRADGAFRIFLYMPWNQYLIGTSFNWSDASWAKPDNIIIGDYNYVGTGQGIATVSAGPH